MLKHVGCIAFLGSTPYFFGDFMDKNIFTIDSDCSGMTVKEYILGYLGYSVGVLKKLKYSGKITVNGKEVFVNHLLSCGEILQLTYPEENSDSIEPVYHLLDIPYKNGSAPIPFAKPVFYFFYACILRPPAFNIYGIVRKQLFHTEIPFLQPHIKPQPDFLFPDIHIFPQLFFLDLLHNLSLGTGCLSCNYCTHYITLKLYHIPAHFSSPGCVGTQGFPRI